MTKGVDVLFEQNESRIIDFRRGQTLGTRLPPRVLAQAQGPSSADDARTVHAGSRGTPTARSQSGSPGGGHHADGASTGQQRRSLKAVRSQMERRNRPAQTQDHHRHGRAELPDARETVVGPCTGLQRDPFAHGAGRQQCRFGSAPPKLQAHGAALDGVGGTGGFQRRRTTSFFFHPKVKITGVQPVSFSHAVSWSGHCKRQSSSGKGLPSAGSEAGGLTVPCDPREPTYFSRWLFSHADCPMQSRPSPWSHRATNAKTTAKTIPLVEGVAFPSAPASSEARP